LTLTVKPEEGGTITGDGKYKEGNKVSISEIPAVRYELVNWTDDDNGDTEVSTENPYRFNRPEWDVNYTVNFEKATTLESCFNFYSTLVLGYRAL